MGISFSCPFAEYDDLDNGLEAVIVRSISFGDDDMKTTFRSVSFKGRDSDSTILKSLGSGKMIIEGSVSFKSRERETMISIKTPSSDEEATAFTKTVSFKNSEAGNRLQRSDSSNEKIPPLPLPDLANPKHEAAVKLQKVYKSFRTRRKLADCAVLVEQRWWKLLDFAELKRSSVSFFGLEKHETAVEKWSRARTRAAKVGKGLLKDEKAQKLALQHWLEAIDPRHRYGHNLQFYYVKWLHCDSKQPFFYWLDIGEGKEVNLMDRCPRSKLQQQCIKYLGPTERKAYEIIVENGRFLYKQTGELLDTTGGPKGDKWIFVLGTSKNLYVGQKKKGKFQHSSFLAGGATSAAGRLVVEDGILKAVWPHSGHYRPTEENFQEFVSFLKEHNVDPANVKKSPADEEEESFSELGSSFFLRRSSSEQDLTQQITNLEEEDIDSKDFPQEKTDSTKQDMGAALEFPKSARSRLGGNLNNLEIPQRDGLLNRLEKECPTIEPSCGNFPEESPTCGYETRNESFPTLQDYMVPKQHLFDEDQEEDKEETIPEESILQRINSRKEMKSYQLGKRLSRKWTTGAGPRIGCIGDYPSELRFRALEQVNLSPGSKSHFSPPSATNISPKVSTPTILFGETSRTTSFVALSEVTLSQRSSGPSRTHSLPLYMTTSPKPSMLTSLWRETMATTTTSLR